jgi:GDSL-like Lipase/Acylhydrolase family
MRHEFKTYPKAAVLADTVAFGYVGAGRGWPDYLAGQMCWSVSGKSVELETGYTNPGGKPDTSAFTERADDVAKDGPKIVVVEGGMHDYRATPEKLQEAAAATFSTLKSQLPPDAMVVAVGPIVGDAAKPEDVARISGPIAAAAAEKGVIFLDPMVEGWLPNMDFFSRDGLLPNDKGQIEYANRLAADLRALGAPAGC